jgi:hypothetical protein
VEAKQATPGKASKSDEVLRLIAKLYQVEKVQKSATEQVRLHARQTESKALLEAIRQGLRTHKMSAIGELLPHRWQPLQAVAERVNLF